MNYHIMASSKHNGGINGINGMASSATYICHENSEAWQRKQASENQQKNNESEKKNNIMANENM